MAKPTVNMFEDEVPLISHSEWMIQQGYRLPRQSIEVINQVVDNLSEQRPVNNIKVKTAVALGVILTSLASIMSVWGSLSQPNREIVSNNITQVLNIEQPQRPQFFNLSNINDPTKPFLFKSVKKSRKVLNKSKKSPKKSVKNSLKAKKSAKKSLKKH